MSIFRAGSVKNSANEAFRAGMDARIRRHFDDNTDLYVDVYAETYKAICRKRIELLRQFLNPNKGESLRILDIGCGGGVFLDMLLEEYPNSQAVGLDASMGMLKKNAAQARKALILGDAKELPFGPHTVDLVNVDTVMHHLIDLRGYRNTLSAIREFLLSVSEVLKPVGILIVHEIYHEYLLQDNLGSRMVYELSTLKLPAVAAHLLKRMGMMTANAGVCFLTRRQWHEMFEASHFEVLQATQKAWVKYPFEKIGFNANGDLYYVLRPRANGIDSCASVLHPKGSSGGSGK